MLPGQSRATSKRGAPLEMRLQARRGSRAPCQVLPNRDSSQVLPPDAPNQMLSPGAQECWVPISLDPALWLPLLGHHVLIQPEAAMGPADRCVTCSSPPPSFPLLCSPPPSSSLSQGREGGPTERSQCKKWSPFPHLTTRETSHKPQLTTILPNP